MSNSDVRKNINIKFKSEAAEVEGSRSRRKSRSRSRSRSYDSSVSSHSSHSDRSRSGSREHRRHNKKGSRHRSRSQSYDDRSHSGELHSNGVKGRGISSWNFDVNVSSERVSDPVIFICDICRLPVINYGRLLPCKHTFCYICASKMFADEKKSCKKCRNAITTCELCPPGSLFICTHDGTKLSGGCRRAYKTAEDLQTHGNQRHSGSIGGPLKEGDSTLEPAGSVLASIVVGSQSVNFTSSAQSVQSGIFQQPQLSSASNFPVPNVPFTGNPLVALQAMQGNNLFNPANFNPQQMLNPAFFLANMHQNTLMFPTSQPGGNQSATTPGNLTQ